MKKKRGMRKFRVSWVRRGEAFRMFRRGKNEKKTMIKPDSDSLLMIVVVDPN